MLLSTNKDDSAELTRSLTLGSDRSHDRQGVVS